MEKLWSSNINISNGNIKCPIGKSIFTVNLPLELFRVTIANADIESLKSLHTFLKKMFVPHASKIWTKSYGPNYKKFWAFWQKKKQVLKPFLTKHWRYFGRCFCSWNNCLILTINPNTFTGLVGKGRKKTKNSWRRKEGRVEKKVRAARPRGPGLEPGTYRVLGEGLQLHATGVV